MVIEDFGPELGYIPGPTNVVADTLSRLNWDNNNNTKQINYESFTGKSLDLAELFAGHTLSDDIYVKF